MPYNTTWSNNFLNLTFAKTTSISAPATVYIGLCSNDPVADGGTFTELSGNGYSRVLIAQRGESYPNVIGTAANRAITNPYQINWTKATGDWAEAKGFGLFEAASGGTPYYFDKLDEPYPTAAEGAVALFDPNTLKLTFPLESGTAE